MSNLLISPIFAIIDLLITLPASLVTRLLDQAARISNKADSDDDTQILECSYRLDPSLSSTLTLPDSRILSYAQYGSTSTTAKTVFFLHGCPGSRAEGTYLDEPAKAANVRIITIDRPGMGSSTPDPNRTIASHAKDVEMLAQHVGAERYGVLGVSGGGPYALACANFLPADKLVVVSIVCGLGPSDIGYRGMYMMNYLGWAFAIHYLPRFIRWWFSREATARLDLGRGERLDMLINSFEKAQAEILPKDAKFFGDLDVMKVRLRTGEEVFAQGSRYWAQDMSLLASDMGFDVADIRKDLKVQLLYGKLDRNVPLKHGQEIARRLRDVGEGDGRVTLRVTEGDTHASIFFDCRDEIVQEMAKVMSSRVDELQGVTT